MKKTVLFIIVLFSFLALVGCSKEEVFISTDDVNTNTILVKRDGSIYVAIVEDFNKSYYDLSELNEFVSAEVNKYNNNLGSNEVVIEELGLKNGMAILILRYSKMEHYSSFNEVPAAYYSASTQDVALELPDQYVNAKKNSVVDKETAMKNVKNKVLVLYEPYEIIVEGDIKFYSNDATLIEGNKIISSYREDTMDVGEDVQSNVPTVVIYRP